MGRGRGQRAGATAEVRPRGAPWRPTELQRAYRALLDSAKDEPQTIVDSDGTVLELGSKERADFEHALVRHLGEAAQFQAAFSRHGAQEAAEWAALTPYPWLASFDRAEVAEFARELYAYALDAARRQTIDGLEGNLRAWQSTAEVYEQPEVLEALMAPIDPNEIVEVFPPSEDQVREAGVDAG